MRLSEKIRLTFRDIFGSRIVNTLEIVNVQMREDFERRLNDKDDVIANLRADLQAARLKIEVLETVVIPVVSPVGNLFKPKPDTRTFEKLSGPEEGSWAWVQAEWAKKQKEEAEEERNSSSGISGQGIHAGVSQDA
jgi:hypothetical protein